MPLINLAYPLRLQTDNSNTALYVQAVVRDAAASIYATVALAHISLGLYGGQFTPTGPGIYTVVYRCFTDAGMTAPATNTVEAEQVEITAPLVGRQLNYTYLPGFPTSGPGDYRP